MSNKAVLQHCTNQILERNVAFNVFWSELARSLSFVPVVHSGDLLQHLKLAHSAPACETLQNDLAHAEAPFRFTFQIQKHRFAMHLTPLPSQKP